MPWTLMFGSRISYLFSPLRYYVCFHIDIYYQTFLVGLSRTGVSEGDKECQNFQGHQSNHTGVVNPWTISGRPAETLEQTISEVLITRRMTSCFSRLLRVKHFFLQPFISRAPPSCLSAFHTLLEAKLSGQSVTLLLDYSKAEINLVQTVLLKWGTGTSSN